MRAEIQPKEIYKTNMHKPCLAQHAAFLTKLNGGDAEWLRAKFYYLQTFVNNYINHHRDRATGLYYWQNDVAIGVDNDPCTYYRPSRSSGSIFLNCLMYKELKAVAYLCERLGLSEIAPQYQKNAFGQVFWPCGQILQHRNNRKESFGNILKIQKPLMPRMASELFLKWRRCII